jgi:hypothetical protein
MFGLFACAFFVTLTFSLAKASPNTGGIDLVIFDCQPNHSLFVKAITIFDIKPKLDEHTIDIKKLSSTLTKECQVTGPEKAIVKIEKGAAYRNYSVTVFVGEKLVGIFKFGNPYVSATFIIKNEANAPEISVINSTENRLVSHSYQARCEIDKDHTIEQIAAEDHPWSNKIPNGYKMDDAIIPFVIIGGGPDHSQPTYEYSLPSTEIASAKHPNFILRSPYRGVALCRVQGQDDKKWLVVRLNDTNLVYIPEENTEEGAEYDAEQWANRHNVKVTVDEYREASEAIKSVMPNISSSELRGQILDLANQYEKSAGPRAVGQ